MTDLAKIQPMEEKDYLLSIVPELPADFSEWVMDLFEGHHIIFYSKPDRELLLECCHCGAKRRYTFKKNDRFLPTWDGDLPTWDGDLPGNFEDAFCPFCECGAMTVAKTPQDEDRVSNRVIHREGGPPGQHPLRRGG